MMGEKRELISALANKSTSVDMTKKVRRLAERGRPGVAKALRNILAEMQKQKTGAVV